ncbi:hypothetical protein [Psychromonas sp.]|jgi:hypothetical protein|uniref:hypothetical protein n=1 Tax=Psychromonas sp. TaxID=1884585 RepID=UPI003A96FCF3
MSNIHQLNNLPKQATINLIASYKGDFENGCFDYCQLLEKLQDVILRGHFMDQEDNAAWMMHRGHDYLSNPKLFAHAPLTYLCAFLSETFKKNSLNEIERSIPSAVFSAILTRLNDFK